MNLPDQAIQEFMAIYRQQYQENINQREATRKAYKLLRLCELIYLVPDTNHEPPNQP